MNLQKHLKEIKCFINIDEIPEISKLNPTIKMNHKNYSQILLPTSLLFGFLLEYKLLFVQRIFT